MKGKLVGKKLGFSTLEIIIALTVISVALTGAVNGVSGGQYWRETGQVRLEALNENIKVGEIIKKDFLNDYYKTVGSSYIQSENCNLSSLCYHSEIKVDDISSCAKNIEVTTFWRINNYPTSSTESLLRPFNVSEIFNLGGDCIISSPVGDWSPTPQSISILETTPAKQINNLDLFQDKIYLTTNSSPSFHIYGIPNPMDNNIHIINSYDIEINNFSLRINSLDIYKEQETGRIYAFLALATSTKQFAVLDVTDPLNIELKSTLSLRNVNPSGSFPQGYKVFAYGKRLYITTRETSGLEFHIFNIDSPESPFEIGNGFELNRTVNNIVVRDQKVNGVQKRLVFLASDSNIKEFGILDVTNDSVSEINFLNLPGNQDGLSLSLSGDKAFIGRSSNTSGPEIYIIDIANPTGILSSIKEAEVSANVTGIDVSGKYVYIGTNRTGENFQIWDSDYTNWNSPTLNAGRLNSFNFPNISPLGFDLSEKYIVLVNNSSTLDRIQIIKGNEN